jgi:PAS domain S-box-containing protein
MKTINLIPFLVLQWNDLYVPLLVILFFFVGIVLLFYYNQLIKKEKEFIRTMNQSGFKDSLNGAELLDTLIENIPYNVYFKDLESKFTLINSQQAKTLGIKHPDQAIGKSDFDYFEHAQQAFEDEQRIIQTGIPLIDKVEHIQDAEGNQVWVSTSKIPIYDKTGTIVGLAGITKDITQTVLDRQNLMEAKRKAEEGEKLKSYFFANMSHEIRTPMNAIIGFSDLLMQKNIDSEAKQYLKYIINSGNILLNLIDDIIDIAKIEANQLKISYSFVKIFEIFEELYNFALNRKEKLKKKELKIILKYSENDKDIIIKTDAYRIKQILNNFISNAFKFTEKGSITLAYSITYDNKLVFFVKDTGSGIPKEKQKIIFQQFGQIDDDISRNRAGTGLGLFITDSIIQLMNGKIWLESQIDKGSTFFVELPIEIVK